MEAEWEGDASAMLEALRSRISRLEDESSILDTLHRYGQAIDDGLDQAWADLFTEDGVFLCVDRFGHVILREQGRDALAKWVRDFRAGETYRMKHCVLAPVINIHGHMADVESRYANLIENHDQYGAPQIRFMGCYRDEMVRGTDGRWRFRLRVSQTEAPLVKPPAD